jgi:hypothetical protein
LLERRLAPFKPFRGIAAYYLAVHWRLCRSVNGLPTRCTDQSGRSGEAPPPTET